MKFKNFSSVSRPSEPPIARTTEYVRRECQALVNEVPKHPDRLMIDIIASVFGKRCAESRQTVEASLLSEEAARQLSADPGTPCLRILRRYLTERGELLLTTVSVHPASRYAFSLNVKLDAEDRIS